jgi:hypothetical protein
MLRLSLFSPFFLFSSTCLVSISFLLPVILSSWPLGERNPFSLWWRQIVFGRPMVDRRTNWPARGASHVIGSTAHPILCFCFLCACLSIYSICKFSFLSKNVTRRKPPPPPPPGVLSPPGHVTCKFSFLSKNVTRRKPPPPPPPGVLSPPGHVTFFRPR